MTHLTAYYILGTRTSKKRYKKFRRRSCTRKRRYPTCESAECKGCRVYHCEICDGYHRATIRNGESGSRFLKSMGLQHVFVKEGQNT